jgi:hypothetical protein
VTQLRSTPSQAAIHREVDSAGVTRLLVGAKRHRWQSFLVHQVGVDQRVPPEANESRLVDVSCTIQVLLPGSS